MRNIHLTPQLVRAVRDAADVVAIAGDHTRLARRGNRWVGLCPLHKEKTPSFSVDAEQGLFYCFGCGAGGDAIKLHMLTSGDDFPAAIEALARRYGIPLPAVREDRGGARRERAVEGALEEAAEFFRRALAGSREAREYLERRQVPGELVERFGLGYAPAGWQDLSDALGGKIPGADLEAAGLVARSERGERPYDRFRHRLIFPIRSPSGRLVGFGGRALGDDRAKYINTGETAEFHKGRLLYGLPEAKRAIREAGRAVLVEGYFDVLGTVASGVEGAVASMGTALTAEQAKLVARYAQEVVVAYDGDAAGEAAFQRALPLLLGEGLAVDRARFGEGHDPDSLRLAAGPAAVRAAVEGAEDGVLLEMERLAPREAARTPHEQARAARAVGELLRPLSDGIVRLGYGRLAADRLGVPVELLWRRVEGERTERERHAAGRGAPPATPDSASRPPRSPGVDFEDAVLSLLLAGRADGPRREELPGPEVFFDPVRRNIYGAFLALYTGEGGTPPTFRQAAVHLEGDETALQVLSRLANAVEDLVENAITPENRGLAELLDNLERRWRKLRLAALTKELNRAQEVGDAESRERLLQEKTELTRRLHPGTLGDPLARTR